MGLELATVTAHQVSQTLAELHILSNQLLVLNLTVIMMLAILIVVTLLKR
jgi:hypothetical protein